MAIAGVVFALTSVVALLILAATIGVISPTGNEVGPVPRGRAGGAERDDAGRAPDGDVRLVQPRRLRGDGVRGAGGGHRDPGPDRCGLGGRRRLPRDRRRLCGARAPDRPDGVVRRRRGRAAAARRRGRLRDPAPPRPRPVEGDRRPAVGPVRDRRLRRRLRPAGADGLLVPPPVRRPAGGARGALLRREPARRGVVAVARPASPPGSASSTRWCSPTCPRTCC